MGLKVINLVHLSIFFLVICCNGTDGRIISNSSAVKTIMTNYGDIYDCVDFYKQPAFDHPLLKNHTFDYQKKMTPVSLFDAPSNDNKEEIKEVTTELEGEGCPIGTVPIRRVAKSDISQEKVPKRVYGRVYTAIARKIGERLYKGAGGIMSIHNPKVTIHQYSGGRLKILNGPDSIEAGWRVDPKLYGDTFTRFYVRTDAGETHCFNTLCPGFILTSPRDTIDAPLLKAEPPNPLRHEIVLAIVWEEGDNWGIYRGNDLRKIGFWPNTIFTGLKEVAGSIEWGGVVYDPNPTPKPTVTMGTGRLPGHTLFHDAYFRQTSEYITRTEVTDAGDLEAFSDSKFYFSSQILSERYHRIVRYGGPV